MDGVAKTITIFVTAIFQELDILAVCLAPESCRSLDPDRFSLAIEGQVNVNLEPTMLPMDHKALFMENLV